MNVYTHFKAVNDNGDGYRWRTLLQFGSSWNVIGSVVMKNPGSASNQDKNDGWIMDRAIVEKLMLYDYPCDYGEKWYEFRADTTMKCIAELFAQYWKVDNPKDLQGVIQIFNLFYIRDPQLKNAIDKNKQLKQLQQIEDTLFEYDIAALKEPVYLGFGGLAKKAAFREKAILYYNEVIGKHNAQYLLRDFDKNKFIHPLSLMRYGKNREESKVTRLFFCSNSNN